MKLLHLQPVSTIFVAISVAAKPANSVDYQVRSLRLKENAPDAPFIGPLSAPHEASRQLIHEPSSLLGDPSDDHRVLEKIDTEADSEKPPTRALVVGHKQGEMAGLDNLNLPLDVAKYIDDFNPDIYYDVEVVGNVNMYSEYYTVGVSGPGVSLKQIPYPNKNVQLHVTGYVHVYRTPVDSVFGVHATNFVQVHGTGFNSILNVHSENVNVRGTGFGSTLKVHAAELVEVTGTGSESTVEVLKADRGATVDSVGLGSVVDVYAKKVKVCNGPSSYTEVTKNANEYVIVKSNVYGYGLTYSVASFSPVDNQIPTPDSTSNASKFLIGAAILAGIAFFLVVHVVLKHRRK